MAKKKEKVHMNLCSYCIQALESHGERVVCLERRETFNPFEMLICDFCEEEDTELTLCEFNQI